MKRTLRIAGILVAVLVIVLIALPFVVDANRFRPMLESSLKTSLARDVRLGDLKLSILSGGVSASDLSVADDPAFSPNPFLTARSLKLGVELGTLVFSRKLHVTALTIDQPQVALIQSPAGEWNYSSLGGKPAAAKERPPSAPSAPSAESSLDLSVQLVKITGGRFSLGRTGARTKPLVLEQVDITLRDFASGSVFPFTFSATVAGGGRIKLDGKAGPIRAADAAMTPWSAALNVSKLDLAASGVAGNSPAAGLVSLDGSGESDGATVTLKGRLQAEKLKLAKEGRPANRTVQFDFAVVHDLRKHSGALSRGDIRIGSAPASLTGSYAERGDSTTLHFNLAGPNMPVPELAEMLPAMGVVLPAGSSLQGGTASAQLALEGPADRLVSNGTVSLDNTRLAGFDLGRKMAVIESLAGIKGGPDTDIKTFHANMRMAPEGTTVEAIQLDVPAIGELNGAGTVSPANTLDFKMQATVHTSGAMAALSKAAIPFVIEGTASQPVFKPDMKSFAKEQVKGAAGKAAEGLLKGLLGGKKQE